MNTVLHSVRAWLSGVLSGFLSVWVPTKPLRIGYKNYWLRIDLSEFLTLFAGPTDTWRPAIGFLSDNHGLITFCLSDLGKKGSWTDWCAWWNVIGLFLPSMVHTLPLESSNKWPASLKGLGLPYLAITIEPVYSITLVSLVALLWRGFVWRTINVSLTVINKSKLFYE